MFLAEKRGGHEMVLQNLNLRIKIAKFKPLSEMYKKRV